VGLGSGGRGKYPGTAFKVEYPSKFEAIFKKALLHHINRGWVSYFDIYITEMVTLVTQSFLG
jgi:hypothetical protein